MIQVSNLSDRKVGRVTLIGRDGICYDEGMSPTSQLSILSYNLQMHGAYEEAFELAAQYDSDAICLQECLPGKLRQRMGDYRLACKTERGPMGLAIYYRPDRLRVVSTTTKRLRIALFEHIHEWYWQRILATKFYDIRSNQEIIIASFHATHLVATNRVRRRQIVEAINVLDSHASPSQLPTILAGDYNYPLFHRRLRKIIENQGYSLFVPPEITYKSGMFEGTFDFVSTRGVASARLSVLPQGKSDHMALHIQAEYSRNLG